MPREKLFEMMELTVPFKTIYVDMYELHAQFSAVIKQSLDILDKGKCLAYEHNVDETVYRIQKRGRDQFAIQDARHPDVVREIKAIDVLNLLYAHAPFIPAPGIENGVSLL